MTMLACGDVIYLDDVYDQVVVQKFLDEGGQGEVYQVLFQGKPYALKYYKPGLKVDEMYNIIYSNMKKGAPDENFLWPLHITRKDPVRKSFGYLMELYDPARYKSLSEFRYSKRTGVAFATFDSMYNAAYNICKSFRKLHFSGYTYMDISDRNILADPNTGEVLICDCDNCIPSVSKLNPGIVGTPGFMAPEILMGECRPNRSSDQFSLAVLLFELFYVDHPLEGAATLSRPLTDQLGALMFGKYATFVMKPGKNPNGPVPGKTDTVIKRWNGNMYPEDMKEIFLRAFTTGLDKNGRLLETEWIRLLVKLRGQTLTRGTKSQFVNAYKQEALPKDAFAARCGNLRFVLAPGSSIYKTQLQDGEVNLNQLQGQDEDDFHKVVARVGASSAKERMVCIRNEMKDCTWQIASPKLKNHMAAFGDVVVLEHGMKIFIRGKVIHIL